MQSPDNLPQLAEDYIAQITVGPTTEAKESAERTLGQLQKEQRPYQQFKNGQYDVRGFIDWAKVARDFGADYHNLYTQNTPGVNPVPMDATEIAARRSVIAPLIWMEGRSPKIAGNGKFERETQLPWKTILGEAKLPSAFLSKFENKINPKYPFKFIEKRLRAWTQFDRILDRNGREITDLDNTIAKESVENFYEWSLARFAHQLKRLGDRPAEQQQLIESSDPRTYQNNLLLLRDMIARGYINGPQLELFMDRANPITRDVALIALGDHIDALNNAIATNPQDHAKSPIFKDTELDADIADAKIRLKSHFGFMNQKIAAGQSITAQDIAQYHAGNLGAVTGLAAPASPLAPPSQPSSPGVYIVTVGGNGNILANTPMASPAQNFVGTPNASYPPLRPLRRNSANGAPAGLGAYTMYANTAYQARQDNPYKGLTRGQQAYQAILSGNDYWQEWALKPAFMIEQERIIKAQAKRGDQDAKIIEQQIRQAKYRGAWSMVEYLVR